MRRLLLIAALIAPPAMAAPFIVSAPYAATAVQPESFVLSFAGNATPVVVTASKDGAGLAYLRYDAAPLSGGQQTVTVKARNAWGDSAASSPFTFTAGIPGKPDGITLSPQ